MSIASVIGGGKRVSVKEIVPPGSILGSMFSVNWPARTAGLDSSNFRACSASKAKMQWPRRDSSRAPRRGRPR